MQIKGRSAIVTGGASGLGAASARRLIDMGATVVIADRNREAGEATQKELGNHARFVEVDVTSAGDVQKAVDAAKGLGELAVCVNCAGIGFPEKVLGKRGVHDLDRFTKIIEVNLIGTFNALRLAAAAIAESAPDADGARGVIVNTASVAAFDGQIGQCAYSASKGGVVGLTLPAARDLAPFGIRVVTIAPGIFETPMLAGLSEPIRSALEAQVPFPPRLGRPDEYACLVGQIVENNMLNGLTIRLDGALRMPPK